MNDGITLWYVVLLKKWHFSEQNTQHLVFSAKQSWQLNALVELTGK